MATHKAETQLKQKMKIAIGHHKNRENIAHFILVEYIKFKKIIKYI